MNDNNDDLQNAINGIVGEETAMPDLGMPPAPALDPAAGLMNAEPEAIEDQTMASLSPAKVRPESISAEPTGLRAATPKTELSNMKKNMIHDLIPLMDKVALEADKKFDFYKEIIDETHDQKMVAEAYAVAKEITDDVKKAEALLYLINEAE
ncbi:hypothetical protein EUA78_00975 [TM7 phylum sp. oral taxon 351]|nr:hypothetical protein EUA78_00975 [TM7 phylum sp. oral taxon 351]